jgi:hypothetical protein
VYVRPEIDGRVTTLGVSGKLWRDSLIMYDRATRSLWSQVLGEAVAGPLKGQRLEVVPSEVVSWGEWKRRHPDSLVLTRPPLRGSAYADYHRDPGRIGVTGTRNPDRRLSGKVLVFGMQEDGRSAAVPFPLLERQPVLNAEAFGRPIVVFSPRGEHAALAYDRVVDGKPLRFEQVPGTARLTVRDVETGSIWSWEDGACVQGPFEGRLLSRITGTPVYWGIWAQFHPDTELIGDEG